MIDLANFFSVILSWSILVATCAAVGGVAFALVVLRPGVEPAPRAVCARARVLRIIAAGGLALAALQLAALAAELLALTDGDEIGPFGPFLGTAAARAGGARILLGLGLALAASAQVGRQTSLRGWAVLGTLAGLLVSSGAWLSHAFGRVEHRGALMILDAAHQLGAAVWVGGLIDLVACRPLWHGLDAALGVRILHRFSTLAVAAILWIIASGLGLSFFYVDSLSGLAGTGYGVMLAAKGTLLAGALALGALNFLAVRSAPKPTAATARSRWLVEAEVGLGLTILVAAASLTAQPPAVDVGPTEGRATARELVDQFLPRMPRIASPSVATVLASERSAAAVAGERSDEHRAWSEYNHNMAGLFVLAMGILACLERTGRARWARHWPLVFLGLAAFMFVRDDPDAWPLGPQGFLESLADPEVLQHRLFVALVTILGLFEWRVRTGRLARSSRFVFPILCAAGGGLLLLHMHGVVESKESMLIDATHTAMGMLAAFLGWGRWLELRLPERDRGVAGSVWSTAMVLVGLVLLFYHEA